MPNPGASQKYSYSTYNNSTGFEAMLGFLYFSGEEEPFESLVKQLLYFVMKGARADGRRLYFRQAPCE